MIEIVFVTSSREKLAHARYLCRDYDVFISKQKQYGVGYVEPRVSDRQQLLENSIRDAQDRWRKSISKPDEKIFFIEDTSVDIPALSPDGSEYPGLEIKYWMRENTFTSVDMQLKSVGNDRTAIVRSDVVLVHSKDIQDITGEAYQVFTSQTTGAIIGQELKLETQAYYSWLSSKTFNKWFVPEGSELPLSALPIELADRYDFRAGAFQQMLDFLELHGKIKKRSDSRAVTQIAFLAKPLFIICGPTCAGKTTLAEYLADEFGFVHLEASDFMYVRFYEHHGSSPNIRISDFAQAGLKADPCIVSDQVIREISKVDSAPGIVVTGFRSPDELYCFKQKYKGRYAIREVFIDASLTIRFDRSQHRKRDGVKTYEQFIESNNQQDQMGISQFREVLSATTLINESSFDEYFDSFLKRYLNPDTGGYKEPLDTEPIEKARLEELILLALLENESGPATAYYNTTEIASLIARRFPGITKFKTNVSRYFNQNYHPYYELMLRGDVKTYQLSQTGRSKAMFLRRKFEID